MLGIQEVTDGGIFIAKYHCLDFYSQGMQTYPIKTKFYNSFYVKNAASSLVHNIVLKVFKVNSEKQDFLEAK